MPVIAKKKLTWLERLRKDPSLAGEKYAAYNEKLAAKLDEEYPGDELAVHFDSGDACRDFVTCICEFDEIAALLVWPKYRTFFNAFISGVVSALPRQLTVIWNVQLL